MQPGVSLANKQQLLHFAVVGGGPTGVEFAAELHDLMADDLSRYYPSLSSIAQITVYDVADRLLGGFDLSLSKYASERFHRQHITVRTNVSVSSVGKTSLTLRNGEEIPTGMTVWATGLAPSRLVKDGISEALRDIKTGRLLVNDRLHLLSLQKHEYGNAFALGDCALVESQPGLPCTAQLAKQQAQYLSRRLNKAEHGPFEFHPLGMMAYVGGWRAVADIIPPSSLTKSKEGQIHSRQSGRMTWLLWRSAYFSMAVSTRNKLLIPMYWFLTWIFGRDISKI